tara:strand:+ start:148 stop:597 length:450 start_codon:yes stop_codon:yes gene_type:complete
MKVLSVRQPWAYLIVAGYKPVENRTWNTSYRGPLLIHASKAMEPDDFPVQRQWIKESGIMIPEDLPRGAIVGSATLTDVHDWASPPYTGFVPGQVKYSPSPWFEGPYGFEMADAVEFVEPIQCRGQLGIRDVSDSLAARVSKMIAEARK